MADDSGSVMDIDGNVYRTVRIGNQWWMAENLKVTHYANGDAISYITDSVEWMDLTSGAYCEYDNDPANVDIYGLLYNWYAATHDSGLAPEGWRIPSDNDWHQLEQFLGMDDSVLYDYNERGTTEGGKLKEAGTDHWFSPNDGATNETEFTALPGGYRFEEGAFVYLGEHGRFWTTTAENGGLARNRMLSHQHPMISRHKSNRSYGFAIRCVKDDPRKVAHWKFDEDNGDFVEDVSGYENHGLAGGATVVDGCNCSARQFGTSNDSVVVENNPSLNFTGDFTITAWVQLDSLTSDGKIIIKSDAGSTANYHYQLSIGGDSGIIGFQINNPSDTNDNVFSVARIPVGVCTFLTAVRLGTEMMLYVDGVFDTSASCVSTDQSNISGVYIGKHPERDDQNFPGIIDEIRLYNYALSDSAISAIQMGSYLAGDANGDGQCNIGDAIFIVNYVFKGGPPPEPLDAGDANGDCNVNIGDAVYLINYIFNGGLAPVCGCVTNEFCCRGEIL